MKRKDGLLWTGEVVDKCRDEHNATDGDGRCDHWHGVGGTSKICDTDEEDDKTGSEETKTDKIQLFEFLPSRSLIISLWVRWRIVREISADKHETCVDDTDVVTPSPGRLEIELGRDVAGEYCTIMSNN